MKTFGLRGGWEPFNSLDTFQLAKDLKLDGVQIDVWLTKDEKLAVIHGGNNGEVLSEGERFRSKNEGYGQIQTKTFGEIKDIRPEACLLEEVIEIFKGTKIKMNI